MPEETPIMQDIERLVLAAQRPSEIDGTPVFVLQEGQRADDLTRFLSHPARKKASPAFYQCESFTRYVNEHKNVATRIYVPSNLMLVAVIDHNAAGDGKAGWAEHQATYNMQHSLEWQTWTQKSGQKMSQKDFCEFVEDNTKDFAEKTNMLELVRTLQINSNVMFNSWEKEENGNVALSFSKVTQAQAGPKGEVDLPQRFTIVIPCFMGGAPLPVEAKLRFEISESDKKLKLWYELQKIQQVVVEHTKQVVGTVAKATGIQPFYGNP